jgi:lysyl endopeptidase
MNNSEIVRLLAAITCCLSSFHTVNADGGPDGHGPLPTPAVEKPAEPTLTERYGVWFVPPPEMILPEMETQKFINEDGPLDQGSPVRFSIERSVDLTLADGQWVEVAGGRLWRVDITMTGAVNSRLHITGLALAHGQELALVSPDFDPTMSGVLSGTGDFGNGEAFGICGPSPRTRIEWFVPTGQSAKQLPFTEIVNAYGYRDIFGLSQFGGTCSLNPACYAAWLNESNATCKMTFTQGGAGYLCSAQLVATTAADETPYIATANHCISTQTVANSA